MEFLGHTQKARYMFGSGKNSNGSSALPTIARQNSTLRVQDFYPNPRYFQRSLTQIPWQQQQNACSLPQKAESTLSMNKKAMFSFGNTNLNSFKPAPVLQSPPISLYTSYTPNEWERFNQNNYFTSDYLRSGAEKLRLDTARMCKEADEKTQRTQSNSGKRLGERISDIVFWKNELLHEISDIASSTSELKNAKRIIEKTLVETENPLNLVRECLYIRAQKRGIEMVRDDPEKNLVKEVETIKICQDKLRGMIEKVTIQLSQNNAAQLELEKDSGNKVVAQNLDENAFQLRNLSTDISYQSGVEKINITTSVPKTWCMFTNNNIKQCQAERAASKHLCSEINTLLQKCCSDMWQQWNVTNQALADRIRELLTTKNKLQTHLSKVIQEIFDMNKSIEYLKKSIQAKQAPLQVAQTRLGTRLLRPNVESCCDPAYVWLVGEVGEITETVECLTKKLHHAENAVQDLHLLKSNLEVDINNKSHSLFIDREKCLSLRKTFPMTPICSIYTTTKPNIPIHS
ncbi:tektin-3 isoform X2 [Octopus bimaculoides]|uniref:Tektin n=2 Tax=Octopus bimaculoides TaxID=37653 RepID=A0A0L8FPK9_OCTBM|nr:tektin-3 isoform X2 [Octopus bimaculoides]XP_014788024.1 tektin-3 isoform X2 [Octopus bimaculoides]XP_052825594.1 tektin-3 isoform X2 [Octopus bimaculoides]|eukprot:XP_014788021.1 PREDICTED: tektin-3-like isoform X1 [Octopus bimaculoides]